jgi:hypothetical protein
MANIFRGHRNFFFFSPVLKSPTHIGFIGVKKTGSKISHLGTFKREITETISAKRFSQSFIVQSAYFARDFAQQSGLRYE